MKWQYEMIDGKVKVTGGAEDIYPVTYSRAMIESAINFMKKERQHWRNDRDWKDRYIMLVGARAFLDEKKND